MNLTYAKRVPSDQLVELADRGLEPQVDPVWLVKPKSLAEVAKLVSWVHSQENWCIVPRGAGTGMQGGCVPIKPNSIVLDLTEINHIHIDQDSMRATVGAGALTGDIKAQALAAGLFYPPDPASADISTIGGNIATNAGGMTAFRYGSTRNYVLSMTVVLPDGEIVETGCKETIKDNTGYNLNHLFCGSEGTLGVIVDVTLRLIPKPKGEILGVLPFDSLGELLGFSQRALRDDCWTLFEFLDSTCTQLLANGLDPILAKQAKALFQDKACLILRAQENRLDMEAFPELARLKVATNETAFWTLRKSLGPTLDTLGMPLIYDFAVNPRNVHMLILRAKEVTNANESLACFGHLGDGNIHISYMCKDHLPEKKIALQELVTSLGGSFASEHGIGKLKALFFRQHYNNRHWICKQIKQALDPKEIMNPGKVVS